LKVVSKPLVHCIVDDGVNTAVEHGEPVEDKVHVLGVPGPHDAGVVMDDDEVGVVWQPADSEDAGHYTEHFDNLLFCFPAFCQARSVFTDWLLSPQFPSHLKVAEGHHNQWYTVGQYKVEKVVDKVFFRISLASIRPNNNTYCHGKTSIVVDDESGSIDGGWESNDTAD